MNIGGPELLIILVVLAVGIAGLGLPIWAAVDAAARPEWAWSAAGQSRGLWIILPIVAIPSCVGWIVAIIYLAAIRPGVVQAEQQGPPTWGTPYPRGPF